MQSDHTVPSSPPSVRARIHGLLFNEQSSTGFHAKINRFIFILILLNLGALFLESAPSIASAYREWFRLFDIFSVAVFSFEYLLRLYLAPEDPEFAGHASPRWAYMTSLLGLVDLLAVLPFYLGLFVPFDSRLLRSLRLLRILKVTPAFLDGLHEFRLANRGRTVRQKVHALLFPSEYGGTLNQFVEFFLIFWIVLSVLSIVFESVDSIRADFGPHFYLLDILSFCVFFSEFVLRVYAFPEENRARHPLAVRYQFLTSASGLLDLMAILPFMLELILGNAVDLRFLRIIRMVRLLKLGRYSSATDTMFLVIKKEAPVLLASSFMMFLLVFIMAAFGYLLERGAQPDKFENIPTALYWAVITLASVGYGDISPITAGGRLMTVILALVGIGIFAIPAAILASGFTDQLRLNREQLKLDLVAEVDLAHFDTAAREEFIAHAKLKHLSAGEITSLLELIEKGEAIGGSANEAHESLIHAAKNPAFALAQYRTLLAKMQELAALADHGYINAELNSPGKASELERQVWQRLSQGSGSASEPIDK